MIIIIIMSLCFDKTERIGRHGLWPLDRFVLAETKQFQNSFKTVSFPVFFVSVTFQLCRQFYEDNFASSVAASLLAVFSLLPVTSSSAVEWHANYKSSECLVPDKYLWLETLKNTFRGILRNLRTAQPASAPFQRRAWCRIWSYNHASFDISPAF